MHLGSGGPKQHAEQEHPHSSLTRDEIVQNTKIIRRENDRVRLSIYEALLIQQRQPQINKQDTGFTRTLKLFGPNLRGTSRPALQHRQQQPSRPAQDEFIQPPAPASS